MSATRESHLKAQALGLGFDLAGIAALGPAVSTDAFERWIAAGHHGEMGYLERGAELRGDTTRPEPGMRSAVVVALDYGGRQPSGSIARYARGDDYHRVMWDKLGELLLWAQRELGESVRGRAYVDTGPILERDLARRAGLGWFGKNTMLIHPEMGSFFFLGALFLDLELTADAPFSEEHCGTCTRCLEACPTQAFVAPGVMDARRCISYLTIELRGEIPQELRPPMGELVYGCDICQDVCPWNVKFAKAPPEGVLSPRPERVAPDVAELLALDDRGFKARFGTSAMTRTKRRGLARNAAVALGNRAQAADLVALRAAADREEDPLVLAHVRDALAAHVPSGG